MSVKSSSVKLKSNTCMFSFILAVLMLYKFDKIYKFNYILVKQLNIAIFRLQQKHVYISSANLLAQYTKNRQNVMQFFTSVGGYRPGRSTRPPVATQVGLRPGFFWGRDRSSGRDPDFFMGCDPIRSRPIFKKREIHEKSRKATQLDKIRKKFGSRPPGSRPKLGSRPGKFSGRDPRWRS